VVALELAHSREEMVAIDGTAPLFGILSRPRRAEARGPAVVFVNTGATSHQGAGRMWVLMARRFAELGLTSLRFDVAGVGDSPDRPGQTDPVMEVAGSIQDVSAALDWLEARGHAEVVLIGFCRGAQLSYLTAVSDPRVRAQILIGPPSYFWDEPPVHLYPRPTTQYVRMASDLQTWLGLLKGQIHPFSFVKGAVRLTKRTMEKRRFRAMVAETAARIRRKSKAVQTLLVVGDRDEQMTDMESYLQAPRATFPTLLGFRTIVLPDTDHLYLTKRHRQLLLAAVEPFLAELRDQPRLRTTANRSV
jgi:alpha/beta superfamily hydrolase